MIEVTPVRCGGAEPDVPAPVEQPCIGPVAGQCTVTKCVNLNDPVLQRGCSLC